MPQAEVAALLAHAATQDSTGPAAGYHRKFIDEFNLSRDGSPVLSASVLGAYDVRENEMRAGVGFLTFWTPGELKEDEADTRAYLRSSLSSAHIGAAVTMQNRDLMEAQAVLASGTVGVWGGRRELGFAIGHGGGMVTNSARLDGGGFFLARPVRLPLVNSLRFEMHLSTIENLLALDDQVTELEPYYWTARASFEPHERLRVGITRGIMFGGEGNVSITASRLFKNFIGIYTSNEEYSFANQNLSVDLRYRAPTRALPLALYLEWGTEDAAGGWWSVPGILGGVEVTMPRGPDLSVGVERLEFWPFAEGNSPWYQNAWFWGGWTDAGRPLGHPLGGHGTEWRVFASGGSAQRGINADGAAFTRRRRRENLFAPTRAGTSIGASLNADARLRTNLRLVLSGELERGTEADEWNAAKARAGLRLTF